jgi:hypothetical protein
VNVWITVKPDMCDFDLAIGEVGGIDEIAQDTRARKCSQMDGQSQSPFLACAKGGCLIDDSYLVPTNYVASNCCITFCVN